MKIPNEIREAFEEMIPIYEKAIEEMPKKDWLTYLERSALQFGLCYKAERLMYDYSTINMWIKVKLKLKQDYMITPPFSCDYYQQAIESLKFRLNFMRTQIIKPKCKDVTIGNIISESSFINKSKYWDVDSATFDGAEIKIGTRCVFQDEYGERFEGKVDKIIITEQGDVDVSLADTPLGRISIEDLEIYLN